jgi:hypothetical protein
MKFLRMIFIFFVLSTCTIIIYGQRTINGRIIDNNLDIVCSTVIYNADTIILGNTDNNGYFEVNIPLESKKLIFYSLGYEMTSISIPPHCDYLEIILPIEGTYDFISNRKVDRLRKKEFNKLPKLHLKAFNLGLFIKDKICYLREFKPDKPSLDSISKARELKEEQIKKTFKEIAIGDTIQIPYDGTWKYDETEKTNLELYTSYGDRESYVCAIKGIITNKNGRKKGYNLVLRVIDYKDCNCDNIVLYGKVLKVGELIEYNMKYYKILNNN